MATTESGIYYQEDYNADADVLRDMKKMAESIEDKIIKQRLNATQQDITNIKEEQETQNTDIEELQKENETIKEENERLRQDLNALPSGQAEGEYITLNDSADSRFKEFVIKGNSKQDGEPTPETPVAIQNVEGNANITVCNKNSFTGFTKGKGLNASTGEEIVNANHAVSDFIKIDFNKSSNYYLSGLTDTLWSLAAAFDSNKRFIGRTGGSSFKTFLLNKNSFPFEKVNGEPAFIRVNQYVGPSATGTINDIDNLQVQLEEGTIATDYVPHQEQTFTFPLQEGQKLMLGDYLVKDGIHHVRKQIELDGTENWSLSAKEDYYAFWIIYDNVGMVNNVNKKICNYFQYTNISWSEAPINTLCENNGSPYMILFKVDFCKTVQEWKNWLIQKKEAGTPLIVEYELVEEEIEPYTEEQQKVYEQIVQTAKSYKNVTNIFSTDTVSPTFKVNYRKDIETMLEQVQAQTNAINELLSTTKTSATLLDNLQSDLESEVM